MAHLHLGTSGWSYNDWVGSFYPLHIRPVQYLSYYATQFSAVELDTTFYTAPTSDIVLKWKEKSSPGFIFTAKFPKEITHDKKLHHCKTEIRDFIEVMSLLEDHLGPLLIQFPYGFKFTDFDTLTALIPSLPQGYKYAIEAQHRSWFVPKFFDLLRTYNICLVLFDHPWLPRLREVTSDFVYIRWLGDRNIIKDNFTGPKLDRSKKLRWWAAHINMYLQSELDVFGFFNNNFSGHAPSAIWMLEDLIAHRPLRNGVLPKNAMNETIPNGEKYIDEHVAEESEHVS